MVPSKVFNFVLIGLLISSFVAPALAVPYAWNTDPLQLTWTTIAIPVAGMTVHDFNQDGIADVIYTRSGTTMTRQFGTQGSSSFSLTSGSQLLAAHQDRVLSWYDGVGAGTQCTDTWVEQKRVTGGTQLSLGHLPSTGSATAVFGIINSANYTAAVCAVAGANTYTIFGPSLINQTTTLSGTVTANGPQHFYGGSGAAHYYTYNNERYLNGTAVNAAYVVKTPNAPSQAATAFTLPSNFFIDPVIQMYTSGLRYPTTSLLSTSTEPLLQNRLVNVQSADSMSYIVSLPPRLLHTSFTSAVIYFKLNDGTTTYLGALQGSTLYYTNYNILVTALTTNRALQQYLFDPSNALPSATITAAMPTNAITINWLNGTTTSIVQAVQTVLPSGYTYQGTSSLQRFYTPEYENLLTTKIPIATFTGTHNTITLKIKNAPDDAGLKFVGFTKYNNTQNYVYTTTYLQADNTVTMQIPQWLCGNVFIKDISVVQADWVDIGILCADGNGNREMAYVPNFPLTFYSFDWGATHTFTPSVQNLQTAVRSATTPYDYNVIIKHANGTVAINQTYTTISTLPDTRNFNVSTVTKPASLFVYSDGPQGSQIYSAYLGSPVSLASMASFFNQYFSYQGFNLVSFIPIIFAAMFTRNTVGLGTVLTVVCIATFSWLSIIVVPDLYIYIMAVVAVLGLVGYRLAYPQ